MTLFTKRILCSILLIFLSNYANSQTPVPRFVVCEDFFPRNGPLSVADIYTDSLGYIYFANESGIYRFNGTEMFSSWKLEGPSNQFAMSSIFEGANREILIGGPTGVFSLKGDSLLVLSVPDSLIVMGQKRYETIYLDENKVLHIAPKGNGYFTISPDGKVTEIIGKSSGLNGYGVKKAGNKWIQFSIAQSNQSEESFYYLSADNKIKHMTNYEGSGRYRISIVEHNDGTVLFSNGSNEVVEFRGSDFIENRVLDYQVVNLFIDSEDKVWVGTLGKGVLKMKDRGWSEFDPFFKDDAAAVLSEDREGGIWYKSLTVGFGYISPTSVPHYSNQTGFDELGAIMRVFSGKEHLFLQNNLGDILRLNAQNEVENISENNGLFEINGQTRTQGICFDPLSNKLYIASQNRMWVWEKSNWKGVSDSENFLKETHFTMLKTIGKSRIVGLAGNQLFEVINDSIFVISDPSTKPITNYCLSESNEILVTRPDGVWKLQGHHFINQKKAEGTIFETDIISIESANGEIWIQPKVHALVRFVNNKFETIVDQKGKEVRLSIIKTAPNGDVWGMLYPQTSTLCRISPKGQSYNVDYFIFDESATRGYDPNGLLITNEHVILGSFFGLYKEKITHLKPPKTLVTLIPSFYINSELVPTKSSYELSYDENNITVTLDVISFLRSPLNYQYRMEGLDEKWQTISTREIRLINLKPGLYKLKLRAKLENGTWGEPIVVPIEIAKPFWQTWWFRITITLSFLLLIFLTFKWRLKQVQRKEKAKSKAALELARLEMQALKAQINPHFIFNSITSAMYYLAKNENDKVESYLQRFSKLVRRVLENSDKSVVRLMEEMELIRLYVKLESEQFEGEPISLYVNYNGAGLEGVNVPPTLFQPYIENAIQHGLRTKRGKRYIKLSFEVMENELNIQIQDNGIGRVAAQKETPFKDTKSFGMLISSRRIELLNQNKFSGVKVNDLYNENGNATGTCVIFNIPFVNNDISLNVAK